MNNSNAAPGAQICNAGDGSATDFLHACRFISLLNEMSFAYYLFIAMVVHSPHLHRPNHTHENTIRRHGLFLVKLNLHLLQHRSLSHTLDWL